MKRQLMKYLTLQEGLHTDNMIISPGAIKDRGILMQLSCICQSTRIADFLYPDLGDLLKQPSIKHGIDYDHLIIYKLGDSDLQFI